MPFEVGAEHAGTDGQGEGDLIDVDDGVEARQVERDAAGDGDGPAADAASAGGGRDGDFGVMTEPQDCGDLFSRRRPHHRSGEGSDGTDRGPADGHWPPVT